MIEWHHRLDEHEFEEAPGVCDGQGSLACCGPWGRKELDTTERQQAHQHISRFKRVIKTAGRGRYQAKKLLMF